jgi:hypothetical protein
MKTKDNETAERIMRRTAIERILAHYPDIARDQLDDVLRYFNREASALERATIASNDELHAQYRLLCRDHHFERLKPFEIAIATACAAVLIGGVVVLSLLY